MKILAFNTVTKLCSVSLMIDHHMYNYNIMDVKCHSEQILSLIDRLLVDSKVQLQSLNYIVFDQGPGSFIGVRLGVSVAQGLVLGADLPAIPVSSLEVLAQGAYRIFSAKKVITILDACMNTLYWAHFCKNINDFWECQNKISLISVSAAQNIIQKLKGDWVLVGTGWNNYSALTSYINNSSEIIEKKIMSPEAQDMITLSIINCKDKICFSPYHVQPFYFCNDIIIKKSNFRENLIK